MELPTIILGACMFVGGILIVLERKVEIGSKGFGPNPILSGVPAIIVGLFGACGGIASIIYHFYLGGNGIALGVVIGVCGIVIGFVSQIISKYR